MNYSTAIFLVNDDVRAVAVSYEPDPTSTTGAGKKPYYTFKTMDPTIKVGDYAVIPTDTRHGQTVCRVEDVDIEIDYESHAEIKWLIDRVNMEEHATVVAQENAGIAKVRSAEKRRKKEELMSKLLADNPDLAALTHLNHDAALPAPPVEE